MKEVPVYQTALIYVCLISSCLHLLSFRLQRRLHPTFQRCPKRFSSQASLFLTWHTSKLQLMLLLSSCHSTQAPQSLSLQNALSMNDMEDRMQTGEHIDCAAGDRTGLKTTTNGDSVVDSKDIIHHRLWLNTSNQMMCLFFHIFPSQLASVFVLLWKQWMLRVTVSNIFLVELLVSKPYKQHTHTVSSK